MNITSISAASFLLLVSAFGVGLNMENQLDNEVHPNTLVLPTNMYASTQATATLTVNQAGTTPTQMTVTSSDPSQLTVPSTITVPAGVTEYQFTVTTTASASTSANVQVSANGYNAETSVNFPVFNGGIRTQAQGTPKVR